MNLTTEQLTAVINNDKSICVSAGAGSGKTRVLVEKFWQLIESGMAIDEILAVTFTRKAARELIQRIREQIEKSGLSYEKKRAIKEELSRAWIGTIDSICTRIIRDYPLETDIEPDFNIADEMTIRQLEYDAARNILLDAIKQGEPPVLAYVELFGYEAALGDLLTLLGIIKSKGLSVDRLRNLTEDSITKVTSKLAGIVEDITIIYDEILNLQSGIDAKTITYKNIEQMAINREVWLNAVHNIGALSPQENDGEVLRILQNFGKGNVSKLVKDSLIKLKELLQLLEAIIIDNQNRAYINTLFTLTEKMIAQVNLKKSQENLMEYTDLEDKAINLLKGYPDILQQYQSQFKHIMVDEFQDTNYRQVELIELLSNNYEQHVFAVGDPKQSIYRFRGAEVALFGATSTRVENIGGLNHTLNCNFRTRQSLMDFINDMSLHFMQDSQEFEFQPLGAARTGEMANDVELHLIKQEADSELPAEETEIRFLAKRIVEMVSQGERLVYKKIGDEEVLSPIQFADMAILVQKSKTMDVWTSVFREYDIPFYIVGSHGFFFTEEVNNIILLLQVLDNSWDEIAITGLLRSAMFGVSDEALWLMKQKYNSIYAGLFNREGLENEIKPADYAALNLACNLITNLNHNKVRLSIEEIIKQILITTQYELFLAVQPQGEQKLANIKKLLAIAQNYSLETTNVIKEFLRYVTISKVSSSMDEQQASVDTETSNSVKIMTIHQAKGLEFPLVIIPHLHQQFNITDATDKLVFNSQNGVFLRTEPKSYLRQLAEERERYLIIEEYKRIFYVAKTRACDYLLLSGAYQTKTEGNTTSVSARKNSWLNWLLEYFQAETEPLAEAISKPGIQVYTYAQNEDLFFTGVKLQEKDLEQDPSVLSRYAFSYAGDYGQNEYVSATKLIDYQFCPFYAYLRYGNSRNWSLISNSELKLSRLDAAGIGTIIHKVIEECDSLSQAQNKLEEILGENVLHTAGDELQDMYLMLENYYNNDLIKEFYDKGGLLKEVPFLAKINHQQYINGFIDQLYIRDDACHIIDIKSGEYEKTKHEGYELQLNLYQLALNKILSAQSTEKLVMYLSDAQVKEVGEREIDFTIKTNPNPVKTHLCESCDYKYICFPGED